MADLLRHRQTKGAATDMVDLTPPRHIPTLPNLVIRRAASNGREAPIADFPFLLLVMESAEGEPFQSTGTQLA